MAEAPWSAERFGDADGPMVAVFVHGGFWRARYAAETLQPLFGKRARRLADAFAAIQEVLGEQHDAVVTAGLLESLEGREAPGAFGAEPATANGRAVFRRSAVLHLAFDMAAERATHDLAPFGPTKPYPL